MDIELSQTQRDRYSRHLMLSEVGESGQRKLLGAKVLVVSPEISPEVRFKEKATQRSGGEGKA